MERFAVHLRAEKKKKVLKVFLCPGHKSKSVHMICLGKIHTGMLIVREAIYNDFIRGFLV